MSDPSPVKIGVVGLGGYAGSISKLLMMNQKDNPAFEFIAVCGNDADKHPDRIEALTAHGVRVHDNLDSFLAEPTEAVWLPLPIPLHRPFTEKALAAGKAVISEKPAAGVVDDVDAMIAARDKYGKPVAVGFQDIYDPTTLPLKRELLAGVIGKIKHATITACWPRNSKYYGRAGWAGAFKMGEHWVMDSPANNALSHYINLPLYILGPEEASSATPLSIEAELYRVNSIENYDTCAMRMQLQNGVPFLVLFTHACEQIHNPTLRIEGEKGVITRTPEKIVIETAQGTRTIMRDPHIVGGSMLRRLANLTRGIPDNQRGLATLEVARMQVLAVNAASEASSVHQLAESEFNILQQEEDQTLRVIPGIEDLFAACAKARQMPHESGLASWTRPAGRKDDLLHYKHFAGPRMEPQEVHR